MSSLHIAIGVGQLENDINDRIVSDYKDADRVYKILSNLRIEKERNRIIRCILMLSEGDYDAAKACVDKANKDYRDLIWYVRCSKELVIFFQITLNDNGDETTNIEINLVFTSLTDEGNYILSQLPLKLPFDKVQAISKKSFGPISLLEVKFKSSEYLSMPTV